MRNVHNSVADTIEDLNQQGIYFQEVTIFQDEQNDKRYIIRVRQPHLPNSRMEIEVIEDDGVPIASVLDRYRISRATMDVFMDRLMVMLDDD